MATVIKLTKVTEEEPLRVNFDKVAYYGSKGENTEIVFASPDQYEQRIVVEETLEQVDMLLGV